MIRVDGFFLTVLRKRITFLRDYTSLVELFKYLYRKWFFRRYYRGYTASDLAAWMPAYIAEIYVPACIVEIYVVLSFVISITSITYASSASCWPSFCGFFSVVACRNISEIVYGLLVYLWIFYRLYDLSRFLIDWIVVRGNIRSSSRSLLLFILNIIEVSILITILKIIFAHDGTVSFLHTLISMLAFKEPESSDGPAYYIEMFRFVFGLVFMLVIVAGVVSQLVRSSHDNR